MSDDDIRSLARKWLPSVWRGDVSRGYAVQEVVGEVTYPYASSARYAHVKRIAEQVIRG